MSEQADRQEAGKLPAAAPFHYDDLASASAYPRKLAEIRSKIEEASSWTYEGDLVVVREACAEAIALLATLASEGVVDPAGEDYAKALAEVERLKAIVHTKCQYIDRLRAEVERPKATAKECLSILDDALYECDHARLIKAVRLATAVIRAKTKEVRDE